MNVHLLFKRRVKHIEFLRDLFRLFEEYLETGTGVEKNNKWM